MGFNSRVLIVDANGVPLVGLPTALGQAAAAASVPVVLASDQSAVPVKSSSIIVQVTPTITAGAYSAGDVIGGVMTFANAARESGGLGVVESLVLVDRDNEKAAMSFLLFSATPVSAVANNDAFAWDTADYLTYVGRVDVLASDYKTLGGDAVASIKNIGLVYKCAATSLFAYAVCDATPSYGATGDLTFDLGLLRD